MAEYVSKYTGEAIDGFLTFVNENQSVLNVKKQPLDIAYGGTGATDAAGALSNLGLTATADELNYMSGVTGNVQEQFDDTLGIIKGGIASAQHGSIGSLTRHYKMNNSMTIPWESGTLICDMNEDGSVFRIQGNAYHSNSKTAWANSTWIPGTNEMYAGWKTFKVKPPTNGKIKWVDCCCLCVNTSEYLSVSNLNYNHICIGTDGYVYVNIMAEEPADESPVIVNLFGIVISVDSSANSGERILGDGSDNGSDTGEDGSLDDVATPDGVVDGEFLPSDIDPLAL